MNYIIDYQDIFDLPRDKYYFAHCISADSAMGKGIAVQFRKEFGLRSTIHHGRSKRLRIGTAFLDGQVFSLVTKEAYYHKPTYQSLANSLYDLRTQVIALNIKKLAMPKIGCGLDRLKWKAVSQMIQNIFHDIDIEIYVCEYDGGESEESEVDDEPVDMG